MPEFHDEFLKTTENEFIGLDRKHIQLDFEEHS